MNSMMDEEMARLGAIHFSLVDINLFLDTHPMDRKALMDYNMLAEQFETEKKNYEQKYGPLANFGYSPGRYPWEWATTPWPWDSK
jgi:spore coat protein JB